MGRHRGTENRTIPVLRSSSRSTGARRWNGPSTRKSRILSTQGSVVRPPDSHEHVAPTTTTGFGVECDWRLGARAQEDDGLDRCWLDTGRLHEPPIVSRRCHLEHHRGGRPAPGRCDSHARLDGRAALVDVRIRLGFAYISPRMRESACSAVSPGTRESCDSRGALSHLVAFSCLVTIAFVRLTVAPSEASPLRISLGES